MMASQVYGYRKKNKNELYIDPYTAEAVKLIFDLYLNGYGYIKIAIQMNEKTDYPTPSEYIQSIKDESGQVSKRRVATEWQYNHISRILENELYTGTLVSHKWFLKEIKGKAQGYSKDEYYRHPNHHEAIIDYETFNMVQELRQKRNEGNYRGKKRSYLFSGFCVCGECGRAVSGFTRSSGTFYNCATYINYGKRSCTNKRISEHDLLIKFKQLLIDTRSEYYKYYISVDIKKKEQMLNQDLAQSLKSLAKYENEYRTLQTRKNNELNSKDEEFQDIILEQYSVLENNVLNSIKQTKNKIKTLEQQTVKNEDKKIKTLLDKIDEIISSDAPKKKLLETFIEKIVFEPDKTIRFVLKLQTRYGNYSSMS
jgi:hypothetical protein